MGWFGWLILIGALIFSMAAVGETENAKQNVRSLFAQVHQAKEAADDADFKVRMARSDMDSAQRKASDLEGRVQRLEQMLRVR
jgi:polyhydroxyalkanoate synthesis regulator phasin